MPIKDVNDAVEVENHIRRIFAAAPSDRAAAIRQLFVETLDFDANFGQVSLASALRGKGNASLPGASERIAQLGGVQVLYIGLDIADTDRVRMAEAAAAARVIADQLGDDLLLVFTNTFASQLHFIHPNVDGPQPVLRRMVVEKDLPRRTSVQQVANIYWDHKRSGDIRAALESAFDVELVTRRFFDEYKRIFETAERGVTGFGDDKDSKRLFVQTLFNRLMFVYFLQRKGWLTFKGYKDYLNTIWNNYPAQSEDKNFYEHRLKPLFFAGLNNPQSRNLHKDNPALHSLIGDVPFLNGGLFERTDLDRRDGIEVPDDAIEQALRDLFDKFNFTVMESTPFDIEVAVDPEMLGKVFEELVTDRHGSGSYYTPRTVVSFMCREALKGFLAGQDTGLPPESIALFVDKRETSGITPAAAPKVGRALDEVTVVDPACGSGAYLLGMMQELVELQTALYNVRVDHRSLFELKLHIIERNLYGVDIDEFAVNIAMLRLWLSLAIDFKGGSPPPLPNLDFKILCGDSLLGPDPGQLSLDLGVIERFRIGDFKADYMRESNGSAKAALKKRVSSAESELRQSLGGAAVPDGVVDWRIAFVEVFASGGGFDIAIANPPYVNVFNIDAERPGYRKKLRAIYSTAYKRFDLFVPFMERGLNVLARRGTFAYITPNKYLGAEYAKKIRLFFADNTIIQSLTDLSNVPVFGASVYPIITIARRKYINEATSVIDIFSTKKLYQINDSVVLRQSIPVSLMDSLDNNWSPLIHRQINEVLPLLSTNAKLFDIAAITPAAWVNEAYDLKDALVDNALELTHDQCDRFVPFIVSGNVRNHEHTWSSNTVRYLNDTYRSPALDLEHSSVSESRRKQIKSPKVVVSGMAKRPTCVWAPAQLASGVSTTYVFPHSGTSGAFIAGVLNSRLMGQIYEVLFGSLSLAGGYMRVGAPQLKSLPIPYAPSSIQAEIATLVEQATNSRGDLRSRTLDLIEKRVRSLYGLTPLGESTSRD